MGNRRRTRILIVDDHASFVIALGDCLRFTGYEVVGTAVNASEALHLAGIRPADAVLLDVRLGELDGLHLIQSMLKVQPQLHVVVLTAFSGGDVVRRAIEAGASAFVAKESPIEEVIKAINQAVMGNQYICPVASRALDALNRARVPTERERSVLRLYVQGHSLKEAAAVMGITPCTMQSYRKAIRKKMGFRTNSDVVTYACRNGLIG